MKAHKAKTKGHKGPKGGPLQECPFRRETFCMAQNGEFPYKPEDSALRPKVWGFSF